MESECWVYGTSLNKQMRIIPKGARKGVCNCLKSAKGNKDWPLLAKRFAVLPCYSWPITESYGVADNRSELTGTGKLSQASWNRRPQALAAPPRQRNLLNSFAVGKADRKPKDNQAGPKHQPPSSPDASTLQVSSSKGLIGQAGTDQEQNLVLFFFCLS